VAGRQEAAVHRVGDKRLVDRSLQVLEQLDDLHPLLDERIKGRGDLVHCGNGQGTGETRRRALHDHPGGDDTRPPRRAALDFVFPLPNETEIRQPEISDAGNSMRQKHRQNVLAFVRPKMRVHVPQPRHDIPLFEGDHSLGTDALGAMRDHRNDDALMNQHITTWYHSSSSDIHDIDVLDQDIDLASWSASGHKSGDGGAEPSDS